MAASVYESRIGRALLVALAVLVALAAPLFAQQDRISVAIESSHRTKLVGTVHPKATPQNDIGLVDSVERLAYVSLLLKKTPAQLSALQLLLKEQQDGSSPNYHRWLTPEQYADLFGVSRSDIAKIAEWLRSEGLRVEATARGRDWIAFSGTVSQARTAFDTEFHRYRTDGSDHFANVTEPSFPDVLADLIENIRGFNDFLPKHIGESLAALPEVNLVGGSHAMGPDDLATIYNINPLYRAGFEGTGQRLAVVGTSAILVSDIRQFRSTFGLSSRDPEIWVIGAPGINPVSQIEANLDVEWSGAVARDATIVYDYATNVDDAVQDVIDNHRANVLSMSFGYCETGRTLTDAQSYRTLAQKGNSEGITWLASSGDAGPANCEQKTALTAIHGLSASLPATIPEVTAVGGTMFNEGTVTFWSPTSSTTLESALGYIPEMAWDESGPNGLSSSGGGPSVMFAKPSWQTGPGILNDKLRDTPDVSLAAATSHDAYWIVLNGSGTAVGGTSAATPAFAGMITILNQYLVASGQPSGLSNINPTLYKLAVTTPGAFHDVTVGNNIIPCRIGTLNCSTGSLGYNAGPGYDMATGLGSVNANNLVTLWTSGSQLNSQVVATIAPNPVYQTAPDAGGFQWLYNITLSELNGTQTTLTDFTVGGVSYASQIASFFGTPTVPAKGIISAYLGYKTLTVPSMQVFVFSGVDAGGRQWSQQVSVSFLGPVIVAAPVVRSGGIGPLFSSSTTIQPGSWVSIYGTNLAPTNAVWNGNFPTSLGGTNVTINGKPAYLWFVSPTQINLQAPDDATRGSVPVVVTTAAGAFAATVNLGSAGPSFSLLDGKHAAAIILRSNGSGAFGGGTYDILGPPGVSLGYRTVAAKFGDNVLLFGVGFGPTNPAVPAGKAFSGAAATTNAVQLQINSKIVIPSFIGLSSAGLYQFNFTIPAALGAGDVSLQANSGGAQTPLGVVISLQ